MKGKTPKLFILLILLLMFVVPARSQQDDVPIYSMAGDTVDCPVYLSVYREFLRLDLYNEAIIPWRNIFNECGPYSELIYLDGVTMYRSFIETAPEGPVKEGLIDTLMLIYDRRMEFFGGEGNVLGRKGRDLLAYRSDDIEQVQRAYDMLRRSIELQGMESQDVVMMLCISSGISLYRNGKIEDTQVIEDYMMITGILNRHGSGSSRWERARENIDELMQNAELLSCESLDPYYEPLFELNRDNRDFLTTLVSTYNLASCDRSDIYAEASEELYRIEPGPEAAHNLALTFISRNELEKASGYLEEALQGENIPRGTRAEWYYKLAVVNYAIKDYCSAIDIVRNAIDLRGDYGEAYILLGNAFIEARFTLGEEFQQRAAFWAAADMYQKAISVDPSVTDEAMQLLKTYEGQYPGDEDIFFNDLKEGDAYQVGGCINQETTVR